MGGEEIPRRETLTCPRMDVIDGPDFQQRVIMIPGPSAREWAMRNKVTNRLWYAGMVAGSFVMHFGHTWNKFMPESLRKAHPEWKAFVQEPATIYRKDPDVWLPVIPRAFII